MGLLLVQGIRTPIKKQLSDAFNLEKESGLTVESILNPSQGTGRDLLNASLGVIRHCWGVNAERASVRRLSSRIMFRLRQDKPVVLCVYSQGSIIAKDAIDVVRRVTIKRHGEKKWEERASKISIVAVGAANHLWRPELASVLSFKVPNDPISSLTAPIGRLLSFFKRNDYIFIAPTEVVPIDPALRPAKHSFAHYLGTLTSLLQKR